MKKKLNLKVEELEERIAPGGGRAFGAAVAGAAEGGGVGGDATALALPGGDTPGAVADAVAAQLALC